MGGAEVEDDLSGQLLLTRRAAHGERLHPRLDALQTPDVGARPRNATALGSVELASGRGFLRAGRHGRGTMPAAVAATGRRQRQHGGGEHESPGSR